MRRDIEDKILHKLEELETKEGQLPAPLELYRRILAAQIETKASLGVPPTVSGSLPEEAIAPMESELTAGVPLLSFEKQAVEWATVQCLLRNVSAIVLEYLEDAAKEAPGLESLASDMNTLEKAAQAWYECSPLCSYAEDKGVSEELLSFVLQTTLHPFLASNSEALIGLIDQEAWRRGYCPICGGVPDFAFLTKDLGTRWLLCSRCDAEWLFQRLQCPYCGNQDQNTLAYFTDDSELYRLYVCEHCHRYIKAIDLRRTGEEILMPLERILTAEIDNQAQETGYEPGPPCVAHNP